MFDMRFIWQNKTGKTVSKSMIEKRFNFRQRRARFRLECNWGVREKQPVMKARAAFVYTYKSLK
jgi:hypothetical protein